MTDLDHGADLRERIDVALSDVSAPAGLTETAIAGGHRLRRRRRTLTAVSGAAAAAVVVLGRVDHGRGLAQHRTPDRHRASGVTERRHHDTEPRTGRWNGSFPDLPPRLVGRTADRLLEQLEAALPAGVEVVDHELAPSATAAPGEPDVSSRLALGDPLLAHWSRRLRDHPLPAGPRGRPRIRSPPPTPPATKARPCSPRALEPQPGEVRPQSRYTDTCKEILEPTARTLAG